MAGELQGLNTYLSLLQSGGQDQFMKSFQPQQQAAPMGVAPQPTGIDLQGAFRTGEQAARGAAAAPPQRMGLAAGGPVRGYRNGGMVRVGISDEPWMNSPEMTGDYANEEPVADDGDDESLDSVSPLFMQLLQKEMGTVDDSPTREDKMLALAKAGFATAAGQSPFALSNIGAGGVVGIDALQDMRKQRAEIRMRESQLAQQAALRQAAMMDSAQQKSAALKQRREQAAMMAATQREAIEQRREAAQARTDAAESAAEDRAARAKAEQDAAKDRADALAEQRWTQNDRLRTDAWNKTGVWREIEGDKERGIVGPPDDQQPFRGPLVENPNIPLRERNELKVAQPAQEAAVKTIVTTLGNTLRVAEELKTQEGMGGAVGFRLGEEFIPGTDAATYKAKLKNLKDMQFRDALQAMRDASRTGGAVGNVSDREGERFENMVASIAQAQSEDQLKESLSRIIDYTKFLKNTYMDKYKQTYGDLNFGDGASTSERGEKDDPLGLFRGKS